MILSVRHRSGFAIAALVLTIAAPALANPRIPGSTPAMAPRFEEDTALQQAIAGPWRPAADKARDIYRHPYEALEFWGLRPGMTIVDLQPGGGYWTAILAPYAHLTHGRYIAGVSDLSSPTASEGARKYVAEFKAKFSDSSSFGAVESVGFGPTSGPIAAPGSVDFILSAREQHNWLKSAPDHASPEDRYLAACFAALKPGGVLAIEDHRADPNPEKANWSDGYVATATVVTAARRAGFVYEGSSEVNANPKDTKDHPFGVWTLPPTRMTANFGQPANPAFDHAKYDAIGESDRFTLRFRKPG